MLSEVWLSPSMAIPLPLWAPLAVSNHHHSEKHFSCTYSEFTMFQPVPIASHPSIVHLWEDSGLVSSTHSHYVAVDSNKILLLSFLYLKLDKPISLSISSHAMCFSLSPDHFCGHLLVCPCLFCTGEPRNGHSTPHVSHQGWAEGKDRLPWPAGNALPNADQDAVGLLCCNSVLLAHGQLRLMDP